MTSSAADLQIRIVDDTPSATDEAAQTVAEGATQTGVFDFVAGADEAGVSHINGTLLTFGTDGYSQVLDVGNGTIKVKVDGSYSYTADAMVNNSSVVTDSFTFTVTDKDGDSVTKSASFNITDMNVPVGGLSTAMVDDDGLTGGNSASTSGDLVVTPNLDNNEATFSGSLAFNFGGDGVGSVDFANMHNTTGTVGQETVTYSWNGTNNTLTATSVRGALFTVVVNPATGAYTVMLLQNVLHATLDGQTGDNTENDATTVLTYTVKDTDYSSAMGTLTITFDDDMPSTASSAHHGYVANSVNTSVTGDLAISVGADGFGSYSFDTPLPNVTSGGHTVEYVQTGNVLTGYVDANNNDTVEGGEEAFRLQLNANGSYTFTLLKQLDAPETVGIGGSSSFGSGPAQGQLLTNTGGALQLAVLQGWMTNNSWTSADFDNWQTQGVLNADHVDQAKVNGSTSGWGVDSNTFDSGEILRMDFNNYSSFDGATLPGTFDGPAVNYATIQLVGFAQTEKVAYVIHYEDNTFEAGNGTVATLAGTDLTMTLGSGKYIDYIELLDVESGGGGKFQLVNLSTVTNTGTLNMDFGIKATDGDGDSTSQAIAVTVDGSNPIDGSTANDSLAGDAGSNTINALAGNDILDGGAGNDILSGGDGNDLLIGGFGSDTLTGGSGKDTFNWQSGEAGGTDVIKDFTTGTNGDVLDLSELLSGEHANATSLDQYLNFASGPGTNKSTLTIDLDGSVGGTPTHTIFFDNVDLTANSTRTDLQIIQDLLDQGNLKVDP